MKARDMVWLCAIAWGAALAQVQNVQVNHPGSTDANEVTIAINPANPLNLAAAANLRYYYYTMDGGYTWTEGELESSMGVHGDPSVAYDGDGNLYFAHLSNPRSGYFIDRMVVQKSTDGGENWNNGAGVGFRPPKQQDKEWIVADLTDSQWRNTLYLSWTEFDKYGSPDPDDSTRIRFARSSDGGSSWSSAITISDKGGTCRDDYTTVEGAVPAVGPNGEIYIGWTSRDGIYFDRSLDGGATFGKDVFVAEQPGGWVHYIPGIFRCNGLPVTVCDISHSPYRGHIYILWADNRNGDYDVFLIKSVDGGETWSGLTRINDDGSGRHQFFPWICVDPLTGVLYVVFYDRRETTWDYTDVYLAASYDGGATFINQKISESSFFPSQSVFFGDYINIAARGGKVYPIWCRLDAYGGGRSIWTAPINDTLATQVVDTGSRPAEFVLHANYPNPFNHSTTISYTLPEPSQIRIVVYNNLGLQVADVQEKFQAAGNHTVRWSADGLSTGVYFIRLTAGRYSEIRKCLFIK
jgi:hypothetical protein